MRILILLLTGLLAVVQVQAADGVQIFEDWAKKCEKLAEGEEICYIIQTITNKETGQGVMQIRIGYAPKQAGPIMSVTAPLGVVLQAGAAYFMQDKQLFKLSFLVCDREGCTTNGKKLPDDVINKMRKGNEGEIRVMLLNRQVVSLPVSLKGFTRAFAALQPGS